MGGECLLPFQCMVGLVSRWMVLEKVEEGPLSLYEQYTCSCISLLRFLFLPSIQMVHLHLMTSDDSKLESHLSWPPALI